jgi:SAM-dependent methyltransferase
MDELGIDTRGYHDYEPSGWRSLKRALKGVEYGPEDSFIDIGCGKGRVVAQAARLPFSRVLGVEVSEELAAEARAQAASLGRHRRCGLVEIVVADSTVWPIPPDVTVIYFYNPLSGAPMQAFLDRVIDSVRETPRELTLLYVHPQNEDDVIARPDFELRRRIGSTRWDEHDPRRVSVFTPRIDT